MRHRLRSISLTLMDQDWRTWDWTRIGVYLEAARGNRTRAEVARIIGTTPESIANVETGRKATRRKPPTATALARCYGWTADSLERVGRGGEPVLAAAAAEDAARSGGEPLSPEEREAAISIINASKVLSEETKARVVESLRQRSTPGNSNDAAG